MKNTNYHTIPLRLHSLRPPPVYIDVAACGGFTLPEPGACFVRFEMLSGIKLLICMCLWVIGWLTGLQISLFIGWYWLMAVVWWLSCCGGNVASVGLIQAQGWIIVAGLIDWLGWGDRGREGR